MKTRVYNNHKAKNVFSTMFQTICFSVWKIIIMCLVGVSYISEKLGSRYKFIFFYLGREKYVYYYYCTDSFSPLILLFPLSSCKTKPTPGQSHSMDLISIKASRLLPSSKHSNLNSENPRICCKSRFEEIFEIGC